ncbi:MAG TPA: hypothetical protein P5297_06875 [Bacilli bacterium]|mgnify:CR=1 FL=1|nr:hypothetical protein [Bacilli bacterium]HRU49651.1 hypothetical protein [Bacilli bacterium]
MSKIKQSLLTKPMTLIVSLPVNDMELARLAWENGADFIKVHTNVFHNASKGQFGTFDEQLPFLKELLETSPVPVGIVPAQNPEDAERVMEKIVAMGFDFVSLYGHHYPPIGCFRKDINSFFAIDDSYSLDEIKNLVADGFVDILECSFVPHDQYGTRFNARDLSMLATLAKLPVPLVLPTQRKVAPEDVKYLHQVGVRGLMIGAIVTGKDKTAFGQIVRSFREAIDKLGDK